MDSSDIKIFYSWQSDLPGNQTRYLIQDSIDSVVKSMRDTSEIIADRDTKGEFGTPDIAQTIFSKIDECDIFVADVSIINKYYSINEEGNPTDEIKTTPNPNVLLELGYAAHALGWENVICIINVDFGLREELPFDIKQRRVTSYSLKDKKRSEVRKELRDIIMSTVMNIQENGKRAKSGFSNLIVGSYDIELKSMIKQLVPYDIAKSESYRNKREELLSKSRGIIETISTIKIPYLDKISEESVLDDVKEFNTEIKSPNGLEFSSLKHDIIKKLSTPSPVVIKEDDKNFIIKNVKEWLNIDLSDDFFYLGNLQNKTALPYGKSEEYIGTKDEKLKYDKIHELEYQIYKIMLLDSYIKSFDGMHLLPMTIYNSSAQMDRDITVTIKVNNESGDIVLPTKELLYEKIRGIEGLIYETGIIKTLLIMPETTDIHYDTDISYDINDALIQMRSSQYDSDDYERELSKYIASPLEGRSNEIEFDIKDLRPKEKKWLGASILVKPKAEKVSFSYSIKSQHSNGELSGILEFIVQK